MTRAASAVPRGFHTVTPYLIVRGAAEAIEFYRRAFGAEELHRSTCRRSKLILSARLRIGDSAIMLNDEFPDLGCVGPSEDRASPVAIHLYVEDVDAVYARAVTAGAEPTTPVSDTFWGDRFGQLKDPFGHRWSLASRVEDLSPEEIDERARVAFA